MSKPRTRREREIWQACDELYAMDIPLAKITGDAIRDQLIELGYRRGSPNEVYKYRKSWQESRGVEIVDLTVKGEDAGFPDPIARAVSLVRESIQTEAQEEIKQVISATSVQVAIAEAQTEKLRLALDLLQQKYDPLLIEFHQLKKNQQNLNDDFLLIKEKHSQTEAQVKTQQELLAKTENNHEKHLVELKETQQQTISALQSRFTYAEQTTKQTIAELKDSHESQCAHYIADIAQLTTQHQYLEKQLANTQLTEQRINIENGELKNQIKRLEIELKNTKTDYQSTLQKFHTNEKLLAEYKGELTQLNSHANDRQNQLDKSQIELMANQEKIGRLENQILNLRNRVKKSTLINSN